MITENKETFINCEDRLLGLSSTLNLESRDMFIDRHIDVKEFRLKLIGSPNKDFDNLKKEYLRKYKQLKEDYYEHQYDDDFTVFYDDLMDIDCKSYVNSCTIKEYISDIDKAIFELDSQEYLDY